MLSPYFVRTIVIQDTSQLGKILEGNSLDGEIVADAVVINTFGEAVPIPSAYCKDPYSQNNYAYYSYYLGQKVNQYNWTWASIVGYPFYYVSNTAKFSNTQNDWGIYGMQQTGTGGSKAFLRGLDSQSYDTSGTDITDSTSRQVVLSQAAIDASNYYGIYPSVNQTSTRAITTSILNTYHLRLGLEFSIKLVNITQVQCIITNLQVQLILLGLFWL